MVYKLTRVCAVMHIEVLCVYRVFLDMALAPNNNEVQIHKFAAGKWKQLETLSEHGQRVTGIDWAPSSNRIVTCGAVSNNSVPLITRLLCGNGTVKYCGNGDQNWANSCGDGNSIYGN